MSDYTNQEWAEFAESVIDEVGITVEDTKLSPTVVMTVSGELEDIAHVLDAVYEECGDGVVVFANEGESMDTLLVRTNKKTLGGVSDKDKKVLRRFFERRQDEGQEFKFEFVSEDIDMVRIVTDWPSEILAEFGGWGFSLACIGIEKVEDSKFAYSFAKLEGPQTHIDRERVNTLEMELFELPCANCGSFLKSEEEFRKLRKPTPVSSWEFACSVCCTAFPKEGEVHSRVEGHEPVSEVEQAYIDWYVEECLSESFPSLSWERMVGKTDEFTLYELMDEEFKEDGDVEFLIYMEEEAPILQYDLELGFIGDEKFSLGPEFSCPICQEEYSDEKDEDMSRYRVKGFYHSEEYGAMDLGVYICSVCRDEIRDRVKEVVGESEDRSEFMARCL